MNVKKNMLNSNGMKAIMRLRSEGVRAIAKENPEKAAKSGFNLVLPWEDLLRDAKKTSSFDSSVITQTGDFSQELIQRLKKWAIESKNNDIILMYMMHTAAEGTIQQLVGLNPLNGSHLLNYTAYGDRARKACVKKIWPAHQYRHVVDWNGQSARWSPCPLERRYWMGLIRPQLELLARVLNETGATGGVALELETYCFFSIYPGIASQKKTFCYCDHCFYDFVSSLKKTDTPQAVQPRQRFGWLTQRGLLPQYEKYLEDKLTRIIAEMMQNVREIKKDMLFGFYPYEPFWYYDAIIRGSGTVELPTLLFSSSEYYGGFTKKPERPGFFGTVPTAAQLEHLKRRNLNAIYVGGLYDLGIKSPEALAVGMDRLLRKTDGYWVWREMNDDDFEPFRKKCAAINRWNLEHPGHLPNDSMCHSILRNTVSRIKNEEKRGMLVEDNSIVAHYEGEGEKIPIVGESFNNEQEYKLGWRGRGALPPLDDIVFHSGQSSLRFESVAAGKKPLSPYIDQKIAGALHGDYELSFWVKTDSATPMRFWVGIATLKQYPEYMNYYNFVLPAQQDWTKLRIAPVALEVLRFWCPPDNGKLWVDDVQLQPVQERIIDVPLELPQDAVNIGTINWSIAPSESCIKGELISSEDDRVLCKHLYAGDNLAPISTVTDNHQSLQLRLRVYPSVQEKVTLEYVKISYTV